MSSPPVFIGDIALEKIAFSPLELLDGKKRIHVYKDASDMSDRNKFQRVAMCKDSRFALYCPFGIDKLRTDGGGNPKRRGLFMSLTDPETDAALQRLDDIIVKTATARSKEWFGKELTEEQVLLRYKPLRAKREQDEKFHMKIKVKVDTGDPDDKSIPTKLHILTSEGKARKGAGRVSDLQGKIHVAPHVSWSYGLWFMANAFGLTIQAEEMLVTPEEQEQESMAHFVSADPIEIEDADSKCTGDVGDANKRVKLDGDDESDLGDSAM